jgi:hypothetical protein
LFHAQGLNGDIFLASFNDFHDYVREINNINPVVKLSYFSSTRDDIERYYRIAYDLVDKNKLRGPMKSAMSSIVNGCESGADVLIKESNFFDSLKGLGVFEEDDSNYFEEGLHQYNLTSTKKISDLKSQFSDDDRVEKILLELNKIHILRGAHTPRYFEESRSVFLTGKGLTLSIAWDSEMRETCKIPLATNLTFIISRLWFKLNKGFGNNNPTNFDVVKNAQILLSSRLNDSIADKFYSLKNEYEEGKLAESQIAGAVVKLRTETKKPEEINLSELDEILNNISEKSIDKYITERDGLSAKIRSQEAENNRIAIIAESLEKDKARNIVEIDKGVIKLIKEKSKLLLVKKESLTVLNSIRVSAENRVLKTTRIMDNLATLLLVLFVLVIVFLIWFLTWNVMEPITYLLSTIGVVALLIYLIQTGRNFKFFVSRDSYLQALFKDEYSKADLNLQKIEDLKNDCSIIQKEISDLQ